MSTLSNVKSPGEETISPSVGLAPDAFPEAVCSKTGVSVRYALDPHKEWYVFRTSYNRVEKASEVILEDGTYVYVAKRYERKQVHGKSKRVLVPLIPNLIFVYTTEQMAEQYTKHTPALSFVSYYYNHFERDDSGKNPPLKVSCSDMKRFILETKSHSEHLVFLNPSQCHYAKGDRVKVVEGEFRGVEGCVARISGQQRVAVNIPGLGTIATAYIPSAFLEKL